VFVSFKNGLFVETEDHAYSFKIGGRVYIEGGGSSLPARRLSGTGGISQARLEVEGVAAKYWRYKLQYDFAGSNTSTVGAVGGIRDAYIALTYFNPLTFQVGNYFEPMGLERQISKNFTPFIEKAMLTDSFAGNRHIGFSAIAHGDNWSAKGGALTTSIEDKALTPSAGVPVPAWGSSKTGWVATGGGQYVDLTGRFTYAPIMEEDHLLHLGASARYHRPNDTTGANDDRLLALGANANMQSNILKKNLLGTPDTSCGAVVIGGNPAVSGKCVKDVVTVHGSPSCVRLGSDYPSNPRMRRVGGATTFAET
jgi:phosphate-selective porin OprO/OprP